MAFSLYPQFGDQALKKIALDYLDNEDDEDSQMEAEHVQMQADEDGVQNEEEPDVDIEVLEDPPYHLHDTKEEEDTQGQGTT